MQLNFDHETHEIDVSKLEADLNKDGYQLVAISGTGELVADDMNDPAYAYRREVYQARPVGSGVDNVYWGDLPGGYEFCRSIRLDD